MTNMLKKPEKLCIINWQKEDIDLLLFFKIYFWVKNLLKMMLLKLKILIKILHRILNKNFYNDQINP